MYAESLRHYLKPIVKYLDDPDVSEVMINGPEDIWIESKGKVVKVEASFTTEGIEAAARNMAQYVGRMLNDERPRLDARLPDGSRIHVVMPPIARKGCTIAIRKFFPDQLTMEKLVEFGSMTPQMARFIDSCVNIKENIIVSGGTGSGKTTMLNCVAQYISNAERILTIEDSAELQLNQEHLVPFESRPPDKFGKGKVDMGDLLQSALRLRPDRIVVGEVRGGEAFHLMQAMNTGHGGSLATVHANTPTDTLRRLESLCLQSGVELPMVAVRAQVASAINVVVCCDRLQDGQRKTTHIAEVLPLNEKGDYRTQDIFVYTPTHKDEEGKVHGYHAPTGLLPTFLERLAAYGFADIDESFFDPATYDVDPPPIFTASEGYKARWAPSLSHREDGEEDPPKKPRPKPKPPQGGSGGDGAKKAEPAGDKQNEPPEEVQAASDESDKEPAAKLEDPETPEEEVAKADEPADEPQPEDDAPPLDDLEDELGGAAIEAGSDEDESTDPGLGDPLADIGEDSDDSVPPEDGTKPYVKLDEALAGDDEEKQGIPDDAPPEEANEEPSLSEDELGASEDELAAIEAALAAESGEDEGGEKPEPNGAGADEKLESEPSIQLAEDLAAEAEKDRELEPDEPRPRRPRRRAERGSGPVEGRPRRSGRRRKGGVIGRPGDSE